MPKARFIEMIQKEVHLGATKKIGLRNFLRWDNFRGSNVII